MKKPKTKHRNPLVIPAKKRKAGPMTPRKGKRPQKWTYVEEFDC